MADPNQVFTDIRPGNGIVEGQRPQEFQQMYNKYVPDEIGTGNTGANKSYSLFTHLTEGTLLSVGQFASTISSSIGLTDEGDYDKFLQREAPQAYEYLQRNRTGVELAGEGIGMLIPGVLGAKLVSTAGRLGGVARMISKVPYARNLITNEQRIVKMEKQLEMERQVIASRGELGEAIKPMVTRDKMARAYMGARIMRGVRETAASELAIAATMNSSEMLFPEESEWYDYLPYAGAGGLAFVGYEAIAARRVLSEAGRLSAGIGHLATNENILLRDSVISRPRGEDTAITYTQLDTKQMKDQIEELGPTQRPKFTANVNKAVLQNDGKVIDYTEAMAKRKAGDISNKLAPSMALNKGQIKNVQMSLESDPHALLGVKEISPPTPFAEREAARITHVDELKERVEAIRQKAKNTKKTTLNERYALDLEAQQLEDELKFWRDSARPFQMRAGQVTPHTDDMVLFTDTAENGSLFSKTTTDKLSIVEVKGKHPDTKEKFHIGIDHDFNFSPSKQGQTLDEFANQSVYHRSVVYATYDKLMESLSKVPPQARNKVSVVAKDSWLRMEAIDEGLRRGTLKADDLIFEPGFDLKDLRQSILDGKFKDFNRMHDTNDLIQASPYSNIAKQTSDAAMRYMLNLPVEQFGEISPLETLFWSLRMQGKENLDDMSLAEIVQHAMSTRKAPENTEFALQTEAGLKKDEYAGLLRGNSLAPLKDGGQYVEPIDLWRADLTPQKFTRNSIEEDLMVRQLSVKNILTSPIVDPNNDKRVLDPANSVVSKIAGELQGLAAYDESRHVDLINEASRRGQGVLTQSSFSTRDDPVMQALHRVSTWKEKLVTEFKRTIYGRPVNPTPAATTAAAPLVSRAAVAAQLRAKANEGSLFMYGEAKRARMMGWVLQPGYKELNGKFAWVIDHTNAFNQKRFRELFGRELKKDDLMPKISNKGEYDPIWVDKLAKQGMQAEAQMGKELLDEQNRILKAMGRPTVNFREHWVPPRTYVGKYVAYIVPQAGESRTLRTLVGNTRKELDDQMTDPEVLEFLKSNNGVIREKDEIRQFYTGRNENFFEQLDAGDPLVKRQFAPKGSQVNPYKVSGLELLDEGVQSISRQIENIASDTMKLMYEPQLNYVRRQNYISGVTKEPLKETAGFVSIWDHYFDLVSGHRPAPHEYAVSKAYQLIESHYDAALDAIWNLTNKKGIGGQIIHGARRALATVGPDLDKRRYDKLKAEVTPGLFDYGSMSEWLGSNFNVRPPATMKKHMAELNHLTTTLALRALDIAHPLMNVTGVVSTMPAVIKALKRRPDETLEAYHGRIQSFGVNFPSGQVSRPEGWTAYSAVKHMALAAHDLWSSAAKADREYAKSRGFFNQAVAEIHETLDKPLKGAGYLETHIDYAIEKASYLADKSEEMARAVAHMAGVRLGRQHGIEKLENVHSFAHKFANDVIGDYRSINKPVVFQGAVGMPLGLFQTYTYNYFQRVFSYIEQRNVKALAVQMGMQASLYGAVTVPGYSLFNSMFVNSQDGRGTPLEGVQNRLGSAAADMLLYGALSSIPKIFSDDGIAIYTRGDTAPRVPAFISPSEAPIVGLATNVYKTFGAVLDQIMPGGQGLSRQQTMEALGTYLTNRPLKGMFEELAGYSVDRRGNVISDNVRSAMPIIARVLGLRPLSEAKEIDALRRVQATELSMFEKRQRLGKSLRSSVRGDDINESMINSAVEDYARTGGDPKYFPRYIRSVILMATTPKAKIKLQKLMSSGARFTDAMRLMNAGVNVDDELPDE